jgi:DeoR/GlpR family transcriptional regulator of sugar metabolism
VRRQPIETIFARLPKGLREDERRAVTVPASASPRDVFARERQEHIARILEEHGRVRVGDLAAQFHVSAVTIRKDLVVLESEHRLVRTHGGAIAIDRSRPEVAFEIRERLQADEKQLIGSAGAALVHDGESIVMDASTTALSVARHLKARPGWSQLTVITNGLRIASELAGHPGIIVLMLGGRVRWEALSVVGQLGDGLFSRINVQKAFLGAAGFTLESGLSDATDEEAQIKRSMVAAAREVIAIVDHTKWQRAAFATFCPTDKVAIVLTDEGDPAEMVRALAGRGVDVRLVEPDPAAVPLPGDGSGATRMTP